MKNLKYAFALSLLSVASQAFAQYEVDALRFSRTQFGGPARTLGIGGANVAVGADLGNLSSNPAGLGLFQRSEFSFTPGTGLGNTESTGLGATTTDSRNSLHVGSLGAAFTNRRPDSDTANPWRAGTFAVGLTRLNDFNTSFRYNGRAEVGSDIFERLSQDRGQTLDDLAFNTYLTDTDSRNRTVISQPFENVGANAGYLNQSETVVTTGSQTQFDFGYGASYHDKLYIGGAIGIVSTRYNSTSTFQANDPDPGTGPGTSFSNLTLRDDLHTQGSGFNARLGVIYRLTDIVRLGAAVHSPTYMRLTESYSSSLQASFNRPVTVDGQQYSSASDQSDLGDFDYTLTTPSRASGGATVLVGKYGFLSGDVEYVDYSQARLSNDNTAEDPNNTGSRYDFGPHNDAIRSLYRSAVNLRVGGEARYDAFRFRLGYARYGDPYQANDFDRTRQYVTGGLGLRQNNFFVDVAGVYNTDKRFYRPYELTNGRGPVISVDANRFTTSVTAGITF
ncbi:hypothetical protein SAMN00120144_2645 [Hymenobacter roseosalivarius DSM 11622]|uniref:Membrane protein involved in aromatic hydrocarbon degradation n=1 Tax=Hymenobacter roseosalivarius DSM 11622 TaxID=645990 RepID=A0A1W1VJE0_9BACT|nr:hypothetical protein [Hymenobacter roseosalivarius]SMB93495.1 hypothetical protein SAMN00120144_2645 [Hymenobacter roseosalivarius DSM 11622]